MRKLQLPTLVLLSATIFTTCINAADQRPVSDFTIRISLDRAEQRIIMNCTEGCSWESTTFGFGPNAPDSAEINGRVITTPAPPE